MNPVLYPHRRRHHGSGVAHTTWNPADKSGDITLSNGNLTATHTGTNADLVRAAAGKSSGLWYFEVTVGSGPSTSTYPHKIGLSPSGESTTAGVGASSTGYAVESSSGQKVNNNNVASYGNSFTTGDVIMVAVDFSAGKIWFGENGTWYNSGNPAAGTGEAFSGVSGTKYPAWSCDASGSGATPDPVVTANFGGSAFAYSPPGGFSGWTA